MSFKPEVQTDATGKWYGNALRFATRAEAEAQVADLMMRWTAVRDTRLVECTDPVNYRYVGGRLEAVVLEGVTSEPGWAVCLAGFLRSKRQRSHIDRLEPDCSRSLDDDGATEFHSIKPSDELALSTPAPALAKGLVRRH